MTNSPSPLSEALPQSLEEIFSADPHTRTLQEWEIVVNALRAQRDKWLKEELAGAKRASAPKKAPKVAAKADISLDDLDL
jgi:hypothetical protein